MMEAGGELFNNKSLVIAPKEPLTTGINAFIDHYLASGITRQARADVWNGNNQIHDLRSGKDLGYMNEKDVYTKRYKNIADILKRGSNDLLDNPANINIITNEGYQDVLLASVLTANNCNHRWTYIEAKKTNADIQTEGKITFYNTQKEKFMNELRSNLTHISNGNPAITVVEEMENHAELGSVILLEKYIHGKGYDKPPKELNAFLDDWYKSSGQNQPTTSDLVRTCVVHHIINKPNNIPENAFIEQLTREIDYINQLDKPTPATHTKGQNILANGPVEYMYNKYGISQERLQQTITMMIKENLTNTEMFTRVCAGTNFNELPKELQQWFVNQGLQHLPCDIIFNSPCDIDHCNEVEFGLATDLKSKGIDLSHYGFFKIPSVNSQFGTIKTRHIEDKLPQANNADLAILTVQCWWKNHSYIVANKFIIGKDGTGGIIVPDQESKTAAVYITHRGAIYNAIKETTPNMNVMGIQLPTQNSSYAKSLFSIYYKYMHKTN